ncbi:MAG: hypothetical protein EBY24_20660 [Betaproteobacteria bacterium]|jgi:hypothetical protein|nr:hypothetical protein [Betaproteobacteria bacterium]
MKSVSKALARRTLLAAAACVLAPCAAPAQGARPRASITTVANFDPAVWERLQRQGPRPAAYVFTTTYCPTCPAVFEQLQAFITASRRKVELAAVVMDVQGDRALAHAHHYAGATRIYAFDGFEPEIRHAVDPTWRAVTPYVVLLGRHGALQRRTGPPDAAMLTAWLV